MNRKSFINKIKYNKIFYLSYYYIGSFAISVLKLFLKPDNSLILFVSSGGKSMSDGPKAIYKAMIRDPRYINYKFVWAFLNPKQFNIEQGEVVQIDSFQYYKILLKARLWITNVSMLRGLDISGINSTCINTWHGTPIKYVGDNIKKTGITFNTNSKKKIADIMIAQSRYEAAIFSKAFNIPLKDVKIVGQPRNDDIPDLNNESNIHRIKSKLGISEGKKVILYAPTFRDYEMEDGTTCYSCPPITWEKWENALKDKYIVLFRAHPHVMKIMNIRDTDFLRDVSSYTYLNELLVITDVLISDYSGILFDYSILGRPMFCFAYDFRQYDEERGLYFDIRKELSSESLCDEDSLLKAIVEMDEQQRIFITKEFQKKYVQEFGHATSRCLDVIYDVINDRID